MSKSTGSGNIEAVGTPGESESWGSRIRTEEGQAEGRRRVAEAIFAAINFLNNAAERLAEADAEQAERLYSSIGGLCDLRAELMRPKLSVEELERFDSEENARLAAEVKRLTEENERASEVCDLATEAMGELKEERDRLELKVKRLSESNRELLDVLRSERDALRCEQVGGEAHADGLRMEGRCVLAPGHGGEHSFPIVSLPLLSREATPERCVCGELLTAWHEKGNCAPVGVRHV